MQLRPCPEGVDLAGVAKKCRYLGSPYHKDRRSFAGAPASRRTTGSICPPELAPERERVEGWLQSAVASGHTGEWRGGFPQRVWHREGQTVFEALQGAPGSGEYHGYPLEPWQTVRGLP